MAGKLATLVSFVFVATAAAMAVPAKRQATIPGQGTWFNSNAVGACGVFESDSQHIAAVSLPLRQFLGGNANTCGRQLLVTANGRSTTVTVTDVCPGCGDFDLDLSPTAFQDLADLSVGRINIEWGFL
ncbi:barwin-like endoglucanase [Rickenella mellea]|uniref:Barwin-like endoglucanase n=1 Tax=Rickenella mellea TaxID=50990 RepID=A0A4Y7PJS4_9AGAM|nr:barwin-like endoglucanase [Rickenella mellea]